MNPKPLLTQLRQLAEIDHKLSFEPQNPTLYRQRAFILQALGCDFSAQYDYRIATFLAPNDDVENYRVSLGVSDFIEKYQGESDSHYYQICRHLIENDQAMLASHCDPILFNYQSGNAMELGLFNLALRYCNDAMSFLKEYPQEYAIAKVNKALLLLSLGDYQQGWQLYENRWETNHKIFQSPVHFPVPQWQGEPLPTDSRLLILTEQGIGDNIQFVRYAILLKQRGFNVVVCNHPHIEDFLSFNLAQYDIPTIKLGERASFSHWVRMMSLPHLCQTTLDNIPLTRKYLTPYPESLTKWQNKLLSTLNKKKIGVIWQGNHQHSANNIRSIPLTLFATLFELDVEFHLLQKEINQEDQRILAQYPNVYNWASELDNFFDTAAIIEQMDLIISIDTSVAHLSAAMGKPTWILLKHSADFRWLIQSKRSVWYDSVTLFRQDLAFDWQAVINNVKQALSDFHHE